MSREAPGVDEPMLARARNRIALLITGAVLLGVLLASGVTWVTVVRVRDAEADSTLFRAAATADDVADPPAGIWLFIRGASGVVTATPGAPDGLPEVAQMDQAAVGAPVTRELYRDGRELLVRSTRRGTTVVQAVEDLRGREEERHRLALAIGLATSLGMLSALALGRLLARRATQPLAEALSRQRRFVADASHELRTPLSRIALRGELLARGLSTREHEPLRDDARMLVAEARSMSEVLNDLLLSAQLRGQPQEGVPVDLAALAEDVVAADQLRAAEVHVALTAQTRPVPTISGSPSALRRALGALVDNALAHTPGGGSVTVRVAGEGPGSVRVDVVDDGPGIDPSRLGELLRPFARGHHDRRRFGLGLALVRDVVEAHGGHLSAAREPGRGACLSMVLPTLVGGFVRDA